MPHDNVASADPAKVQGSKSILWVFVVCHNQCRRFPCGFVCHRVLLKRQAYGIRHDVSNVLQSASWMHVYRSLQAYVYLFWSDRIPFMQKFNSGWDDSDRACLFFLVFPFFIYIRSYYIYKQIIYFIYIHMLGFPGEQSTCLSTRLVMWRSCASHHFSSPCRWPNADTIFE